MLFIIYLTTIFTIGLIAELAPEHIKTDKEEGGIITVVGLWAFRGWGVYATWNTFAPELGITELTYFQCIGIIGIAMLLSPATQRVKIVGGKD